MNALCVNLSNQMNVYEHSAPANPAQLSNMNVYYMR